MKKQILIILFLLLNFTFFPFLAHPLTDNPPNVTGMNVSKRNITEGEEIEICYSVVDDRGLKQVELWREDVGRQGFREINRRSLSGTSASGCFSDRPQPAGRYKYGIHVVDTSGKWNCERNSQTGFSPGVYGPIEVVVNPRTAPLSPVVPPQPQPTGQVLFINKTLSGTLGDRYSVHIFNIDDVAKVIVNGREIGSVGYYQEREFDITPYLREGSNRIELNLENTGGGWTYGYRLKRNGGVLWEDRCGVVGREGCRNNDQTKGTVAKHTITLSLSKPSLDVALKWAEDNKGTMPYRCYEFVKKAFEQAGVLIPPASCFSKKASASGVADYLEKYGLLNKSGIPPKGALVFYDWIGSVGGIYDNWGHVVISLGNGNVVDGAIKRKYYYEEFIGKRFGNGVITSYRGWTTAHLEGKLICPAQPQVTDNPPNVTGMKVSKRDIIVGEEIEICYSVVDDRGLKQVELWREDVGRQGFREIDRRSLSGTSASGCFLDRPQAAGRYKYGIHVVDTSEKWNCEKNSQTGGRPGVYGPIDVVVNPAKFNEKFKTGGNFLLYIATDIEKDIGELKV